VRVTTVAEEEAVEAEVEEVADHTQREVSIRDPITRKRESARKTQITMVRVETGRNIDSTEKERMRTKSPSTTSTSTVKDQDMKGLRSLKILKFLPTFLKIRERSNQTRMSTKRRVMSCKSRLTI
jgi:hypothetical protein